MSFASARKAAGMTQVQVAKALGVTKAAVNDWEHGRFAPRGKRLPQIAKLLGCTVDEILEDK